MKTKKTFNITFTIFAGLVLGVIFGLFMPGRYEFLLPAVELISSLYMNALRMMIYPLVFCSLIVGIQGIGSVGATGRIGGQSVLYFAATTLFASTLGLFLPQMLGVGKGVAIQMMESNVEAAQFTSLVDTVKNLIPSNPVASFANGDMLQVLVFAVIVGIACLVLGEKAEPVVKLCESVNEICVKVVTWVMYCTPVGVFCSIAAVMYANGIDTMIALGRVLIALYVTMFLYIKQNRRLLNMSKPIETRCIHGNSDFSYQEATKAVSFPIYQTATFGHIALGQSSGFDYTREKNPTRQRLEETVSALEGACDTVAFSSGMAAISACFDLFRPGDHIVCSEDLYGGVIRLLRTIGQKTD